MSDDKQLLRRLFEAHGRQVHRRALRVLGNAADADEALQEVFIRAGQNLDSLRSGQVIRWLYRTTTRYCLNLLRDRKRRRELLDERGPKPEAVQSTADTLLTLRALLSNADPDEAQAVTYVYVDQLTQAEAAAMMGISVRALGYLLASFRTWAKTQVAEGTL